MLWFKGHKPRSITLMRLFGCALILNGLWGCHKSSNESGNAQPPPAFTVIDLDNQPTPNPAEWIQPFPGTDPLPGLIATIKTRGGKVTLEDVGITAIDWNHAPINNLDLELLTGIPTLKRLYLSRTKIDSRGFIYLSTLPNLERLALWGTPFTDGDLKFLAHAKNLHVLDLSQTEITGAGLAHLADCRNLETLILKNSHGDQLDFQQIARLKSLRVLDVRGLLIQGAEIAPLKLLPKLEELQIDFCDPELLKQIAQFPNIRRLDLSQPFLREVAENFSEIGKMKKLESIKYANIGNQDNFLRQISKCPNLREIHVLGRGRRRTRHPLPQFTDRGLASLTECPSLRLLDVRKATVTLAGLRQIAQANPDVRILVYPITLHRLQDAFRSLKLGAENSFGGGPRLQLDREMNITSLRLDGAKMFLPSLKLIAQTIDSQKLEELSLGHTDLSDEGLAMFRAGANLKHLNLHGTTITTQGLRSWGGGQYPALPFLETLDLSGLTLDADCLAWIGTLDRLKTLQLKNVQGVTAAGWANLRQLPKLEALGNVSRQIHSYSVAGAS